MPLTHLAPAVCPSGSKSFIYFNSILPTAQWGMHCHSHFTEKETEAIVALLLGFLSITLMALRPCQGLCWGWSLCSPRPGCSDQPLSCFRWPCARRWPWAWSTYPTTVLCTRTWLLATAWSAPRDRWRCRPWDSARTCTTGRTIWGVVVRSGGQMWEA